MVTAATVRAIAELGLAAAAVLGCALSWSQVRATVPVAPIADGQPVTFSVSYDPQQLLLTFVLAAAAGVLGVIGVARMWRLRRQRKLLHTLPNIPHGGIISA